MENLNIRGGVRGVSNYCSHRLSFAPERVVVKAAAASFIFFSIFIIIGLAVAAAALTCGASLKDQLGGSFFGMIFAGAGIWGMSLRVLNKMPEIDLIHRVFYPEGRKYNISDMTGVSAVGGIPLSELRHIVVSSQRIHKSKSSYTAYFLDLVFADNSEYRLLSHGNRRLFADDAQKLAKLLQLPLEGVENLEVKKLDPKISGIVMIIMGTVWSGVCGSMAFARFEPELFEKNGSFSVGSNDGQLVFLFAAVFTAVGILLIGGGAAALIRGVKTRSGTEQ